VIALPDNTGAKPVTSFNGVTPDRGPLRAGGQRLSTKIHPTMAQPRVALPDLPAPLTSLAGPIMQRPHPLPSPPTQTAGTCMARGKRRWARAQSAAVGS